MSGILFITATRIGDAILSTGLLGALIERHPGVPVTVACGAPAARIFAHTPGLERVIVLRKRRASAHWFDLWRLCAGNRWDVVVDLRRSLLRWCLLAKERHVLPLDRTPAHRVELLARTLKLDPAPAPRFWTGPEEEAEAADLVPQGSPVIAVAPGANWRGKIWPGERFAALCQRLTADDGPFPGARVMITGGPDEQDSAQPLFEALGGQALDAMGRDLLVTSAALQRCALFVGNDSGLMHLASAAGIPTFGLFGPTRDDLYGPWGEKGTVIRTPESVEQLIGHSGYDHRTTGSLMTSLTVDRVFEAIERRLPKCQRLPNPEAKFLQTGNDPQEG